MSTFDFESALQELREGKNLTGKDGILTPLIKQLTEAALKAEIDQHLEVPSPEKNRKNGVPSPNPRNFCQRKSSENRCFPYSL